MARSIVDERAIVQSAFMSGICTVNVGRVQCLMVKWRITDYKIDFLRGLIIDKITLDNIDTAIPGRSCHIGHGISHCILIDFQSCDIGLRALRNHQSYKPRTAADIYNMRRAMAVSPCTQDNTISADLMTAMDIRDVETLECK